MLGKIVLFLLLIALIGALPHWRRGVRLGYIPAGLIAALFLVVLAFELLGRI